jgi:hypothetical protein
MKPLGRGALGIGIAMAVVLVASCDRVFGLEAPRLDPCASGSCFDSAAAPIDVTAKADASSADASEDTATHGPADSGTIPDANAPSPTAEIRCGGGDLRCSGATQTCCAEDRKESYAFVCISQKSTCPGTPIGCAKQADCAAPFVCCDVLSTVACVTPGTCNGVLVCNPAAVPSECPAGLACRPSNDPQWPYHGCFP